jgi:hypothetical protein
MRNTSRESQLVYYDLPENKVIHKETLQTIIQANIQNYKILQKLLEFAK